MGSNVLKNKQILSPVSPDSENNNKNTFAKWYVGVICLSILIAGISLGIYHAVQYNTHKDKPLFSEAPQLHVVGVNEGIVPEEFKEKRSWTRCSEDVEYCIGDYNDPIKVVHIKLRKSSQPIALALMSYYRTLWNIIGAEEANIKQVVISGNEPQGILGITEDVPLQKGGSSYAYLKGDKPIEENDYLYQTNKDGQQVKINDPKLEKMRREALEDVRLKTENRYKKSIRVIRSITGLEEEPVNFQGKVIGDAFLAGAYPDSKYLIISIITTVIVILLGGVSVLLVWFSRGRQKERSAIKLLVVAGVLGCLAVPLATISALVGLDYWQTVSLEISTEEIRREGQIDLQDVRIGDHFPLFNANEYYKNSQVQLDPSLSQCPTPKTYEVQGKKDHAFQVESFGRLGQVGSMNNQTFTFGENGNIAGAESFLSVIGRDLNGESQGIASQLTADPPIKDICIEFAPELRDDGTSMVLKYMITNISKQNLSGVSFAYFIDPEIGTRNKTIAEIQAQADTTYANEYGTQQGNIGNGPADSLPDSWEIDEPGYIMGDIFENLLLGPIRPLDESIAIKKDFPDDASYALSFDLEKLAPSEKVTIEILLSVANQSLNSFSMQHHDQNLPETLTISGRIVGYEVDASPVPTPTISSPAI